MTEGTKSVLFGCHSIIHSWYVIRAWKICNGEWPKLWQMICILFHDIGLIGKNYLTNKKEKEDHWFLGACICGILFGHKGFDFVASHTKNPFVPMDPKFKAADRYSWVIANVTWLYTNKWVEKWVTEPKKWKKICLENMQRMDVTTHEVFLENEYKEIKTAPKK